MNERRSIGQPPDIWQILMVAPPLVAAFCAPALGLFWVMGASAFSGSDRAWVFDLGFWAIVGYFLAYFLLMFLVAVSTAFKWQIASLFHSLIWLCFLAFVLIVVGTLTVLSA